MMIDAEILLTMFAGTFYKTSFWYWSEDLHQPRRLDHLCLAGVRPNALSNELINNK